MHPRGPLEKEKRSHNIIPAIWEEKRGNGVYARTKSTVTSFLDRSMSEFAGTFGMNVSSGNDDRIILTARVIIQAKSKERKKQE